MARKTMNHDVIKAEINRRLAESTCNPDIRQGMMDVLVMILSSTGSYRGFRYLVESEVPPGQAPGIRWVDDQPDFTNTDYTRVRYS